MPASFIWTKTEIKYLTHSLFVNYPRFPVLSTQLLSWQSFWAMFIVPLSSTQCSIVIWAKLCNVYCPIVSILHRCWLLMWAPFVVSTTYLPTLAQLWNHICSTVFVILQVVTRKIFTRFAQCSRSCFEVQLTVVEQKPSEQKAPVFPTRAFTSRSGRESASFCTWSLHLTEKLPNIWLNSRLKHNSNSFVDHISQSLNFLWLLRAQGNIWSILHICHFFYTTTIWGLKILHLKVRKCAKKLPHDKTA